MSMLVIGLGNEFRRDDAAGLIAARRLRKRGVVAEEHCGAPAALMDRWMGTDGVILIDATVSGAEPGSIHSLNASVSPLPRELFRSSTHALGLVDAIELSRALDVLPAEVFVFGIEARDLTHGIGLSSEVESALPALVEQVLRQVWKIESASKPPQRNNECGPFAAH